MSKNRLREEQMSDAAYVEQAAEWANALVIRESRGPGDTENAMRRLENRYGVPFGSLWSLRYRKPKSILVGLYVRLQFAYAAECDRQMRKMAHELEITKATAGFVHASVDAAQALVNAEAERKLMLGDNNDD